MAISTGLRRPLGLIFQSGCASIPELGDLQAGIEHCGCIPGAKLGQVSHGSRQVVHTPCSQIVAGIATDSITL